MGKAEIKGFLFFDRRFSLKHFAASKWKRKLFTYMFSHLFNKSFENSSFLNEYLEISINLVPKNSTKMSTNEKKNSHTLIDLLLRLLFSITALTTEISVL